MKYQICPICGATLDHGEKCDCQSVRAQREAEIDNLVKTEPDKQYSFRLEAL